MPEDGPFSWTAHADLAEVDAIALTRPGVLDGVSPALTAPEKLDFADLAGVLSDITGRKIRRTVVDDLEWKTSAIERGLPAAAADFTLGMFRAARRGEFAVTDPTLENLLGRPAISARTAIEDLVAPHQYDRQLRHLPRGGRGARGRLPCLRDPLFAMSDHCGMWIHRWPWRVWPPPRSSSS